MILGAGLAGLAAAWELQQLGEDHWRVFEREERVGGHARSIEQDGYVFDFGPHILFTSDAEMADIIRDLLGKNFTSQAREAFIYHHAYGVYTRFPFQAHLYGLPTAVVANCLSELTRALERRARGEFAPRNYDEWMRGFFGEAIAERLMIPYARKLWTVEPATMDFSWIGRRVPTPDVERIVMGALTDDVAQVGATAEFWYPERGGIEALPRALGERVTGVELGRAVERIELPDRRVVLSGGENVAFDKLVYTLPLAALPELVTSLPPRVRSACHALRFQGICCVTLGIDRERVSDKHWVYFYEEGFPFHRLSFPANFSPFNVPPGKSSISTEIAFSDARPLDRHTIVDQTLSALRRAGIVHAEDRIELAHVQEIAPAYVVYDLDHAANVELVRSWLAEHDVLLAGRFGEWQYFNMDQAMRSGVDVARRIRSARPAQRHGRGAGRGRTPAGPRR